MDSLDSALMVHEAIKSYFQTSKFVSRIFYTCKSIDHQIWGVCVLLGIRGIWSLNGSPELYFYLFNIFITVRIVNLAIHWSKFIRIERVLVKCDVNMWDTLLDKKKRFDRLLDWHFLIQILFSHRFSYDNTSFCLDRFQSRLWAVHTLIHPCSDFVADLELTLFRSVVDETRGHLLRDLKGEGETILAWGCDASWKGLNNRFWHKNHVLT